MRYDFFISYWESLYWHDVGLLKLQTPFVFNEFVNKIELPDENYEPNGLVDVSGYGRTIIGNEEVRSEVLLKTQMLIRSREDCNDHVRVLLHGTRKLHINQICIGTSPQGGYPLRVSYILRQSRNFVYQLDLCLFLCVNKSGKTSLYEK